MKISPGIGSTDSCLSCLSDVKSLVAEFVTLSPIDIGSLRLNRQPHCETWLTVSLWGVGIDQRSDQTELKEEN